MSVQNRDRGHSLEPLRWGGSNEYPQSMFLSRNKKKNVNSSAQLFKTNGVVGNLSLKLIMKYGIYANIFVENVSSFCKSYSHFFFQQKYL